MISTTKTIARLINWRTHSIRRDHDKTLRTGIIYGINSAIQIIRDLEEETQKHAHNNPYIFNSIKGVLARRKTHETP